MLNILKKIIKSECIFINKYCKHFCTAKLLNSFPSVEPVNMSYQLYSTTDVDNGTPPLIIMHGLLGSKKNWHNFSRGLQENMIPRRQVIAVDARNHGESPHSPYHTYQHMAQDVVQLLNHLNIETTSVLGHSMGGRVMLYLALAFPHLVDRAFICDISPVNNNSIVANRFYAMFKAMKTVELLPEMSIAEGRKSATEQLFKTIHNTYAVDFLLQNLYKLDNGNFAWKLNISGLEANLENIAVFPEDMYSKQFRGPVIFVCGTKSDYVRTSDVPSIKKLFPNATFSWVDSGHIIHFERREELFKLALNFFKSN